MVGVSASVNLPLHHKVQKFSSGTGSPGWSRKKGRKNGCGGHDKVLYKFTVTYFTFTTTVSWPLYRITCISRHPQLRTGGFFGAKFYCPHAIADAHSTGTGYYEQITHFDILWVKEGGIPLHQGN